MEHNEFAGSQETPNGLITKAVECWYVLFTRTGHLEHHGIV